MDCGRASPLPPARKRRLVHRDELTHRWISRNFHNSYLHLVFGITPDVVIGIASVESLPEKLFDWVGVGNVHGVDETGARRERTKPVVLGLDGL